jgi:hypothetical protein
VPITLPAVTSATAAIPTAVSALWKILAPFEQMVQGFSVEPRLKRIQMFLQVGGVAIFWQTRLVHGIDPRMKKANARKLKSETQPQLHNTFERRGNEF